MLSRALIVLLAVNLLSACVYRIDIPQGNFLEQKQIDKLQIGMNKEQVKFVLGNPVLLDSFNKNTWHYVYDFKSGKDEKYHQQKKLVVIFKDEKLASIDGDFDVPESFYTPIDQ
ncbi:outer membrane protein assembly factor BamE [Thalassotalea aquiviva]|uniref:outer membrane protein assembly factor BamE n=1 Tax=Thalassotalea aquiviva TaxID=3242415 RepID=UPI00352AB135